MLEISKEDFPCIRTNLTRDEAINIFKDMGEDYKLEIIESIDGDEQLSSYAQGDFIDLCRGPHIPSIGKLKYFKLLNISGAYWRGDENNKMLQRIYGTVFTSKKKLNQYLNFLEEAKKRDHRKLGKELSLYTFDEEVGPGLPLWLPNGAVIMDELETLAKETERTAGFHRVRTPHLTKGSLYEKSGHLDHYRDAMYPSMDVDGTEYYVKPMNCPHHHKIYDAQPKSYRDLPVRLSEYGTCYRYEKSGQLFGLMRVRSMQMNDAHIYCTAKQFKEEFLAVCNMYLHYFDIFGIDKYQMRLSLHDAAGLGKKYINEPTLWEQTESEVLNDLVSVSALDGEKLADAGIENIEDAAAYVPNLVLAQTETGTNIVIRGIGAGVNQGFDQSVGLFVDGVPLPRSQMARAPFLDLDGLEVLRGPQYVLDGNFSLAGSVHMQTKQTLDEFEAGIDFNYVPSQNDRSMLVTMGIPLIEDVA